MDSFRNHPTDSQAEDVARFERACDWFIELREKLNSPQTVTAWLDWCSADPRNREAFERARRIWSATDGASEDNLGLGSRWKNRKWRFAAAGAVAALAAAVAVVTLISPRTLLAPASEVESVLATQVGEHREVALEDGSTIVLGGGSRILADFDASSRRIQLESGEAYFRVARDTKRPFIVSAGPVRVTALGTQFNVRTGTHRIVVAVAEGLVQIDSSKKGKSGKAARAPLRAGAGETVALDTKDAIVQLAHADPRTMASWQSGRLEFTREPLSAVITSVNRYSGRQIEFEGAAVGELRFTGTVFTDRLNDWIQGLPKIFPVEVREDGAEVSIVADER